MIQKAILEISELADEEESATSTPTSIPLLSPSYKTSSLNALQLTIQSLNTYHEINTGKVIIAKLIRLDFYCFRIITVFITIECWFYNKKCIEEFLILNNQIQKGG